MATITITRQLGSLACEVAQALADRLGYRVVWRDLINQAATQACCPEVALATIDDLGILGLRPSVKARQAYHAAVEQIITELAEEGDVVIIGRAGQVILRDQPDTLHVRVFAPEDIRAGRLAERQRIPPAAAKEQVNASDKARRRYLRRYYQANWDDQELYDLSINTARLSPDSAADLICSALEHWREPGHPRPARSSSRD